LIGLKSVLNSEDENHARNIVGEKLEEVNIGKTHLLSRQSRRSSGHSRSEYHDIASSDGRGHGKSDRIRRRKKAGKSSFAHTRLLGKKEATQAPLTTARKEHHSEEETRGQPRDKRVARDAFN